MILPDITAEGLNLLIVGTAVASKSSQDGHYYANTAKNSFWKLLHDSGLTPMRLSPSEDTRVTTFGIGLTDLNKTTAQSNDIGLKYDFERFRDLVEDIKPQWVGFNGMTASTSYARFAGRKKPTFGEALGWMIGTSKIFVLPSSSNAYAIPYNSKLTVWSRLAKSVTGGAGADGGF
ncbi:mismatch-specific DNA-glycosylase [Pseudarthrobacter oxydans]|uniref:mismatch-specific DNA-glycosylase n=1 Tax=Pseudarthrobacter oxydans TaxID=1671 RepID=UPI003ECFC744